MNAPAKKRTDHENAKVRKHSVGFARNPKKRISRRGAETLRKNWIQSVFSASFAALRENLLPGKQDIARL